MFGTTKLRYTKSRTRSRTSASGTVRWKRHRMLFTLTAVLMMTYMQTLDKGPLLGRRSLALARKLQNENGFLYLQILNKAYIPIAINWICGTPRRSVEKCMFIATDVFTALALAKHKVSFAYISYSSSALTYGEHNYYRYMYFRTQIVSELLHKGINVWIIESDSTWLGDPLPYLRNFSDFDVIAGQDGDLSHRNAEGGFLYLNATYSTKDMWGKLRETQLLQLNCRQFDDSRCQNLSATPDLGNEMFLLQQSLHEVKWDFFPLDKFVSGLWYEDTYFRKHTQPVVIQNNWIKGNYNKTIRARKWNHWYLTEKLECLL
jgi:hypothetical protein